MRGQAVPVIAAAAWNFLVSIVRRSKPLKGPGVSLFETPDGTIVAKADAGAGFRHPWQMTCKARPTEKDPEKKEWRARVRPGFVTGRDVVINGRRITDAEPPELVLGTWRNPIASAGLRANSAGELVALPGEGYPPFFASLGVRPVAKGGAISTPGAAIGERDEKRAREIRACDVVLVTPRLATRQEVTPADPFNQAATAIVSTVFLSDAIRGQPRHRLVTVPKWNPPSDPSPVDKLRGLAVESQTDELRIATVWMVSPPDAGEDAVPDETWRPIVQYAVFWNLQHDTRRQFADDVQPPTRLETGLLFADFFGDAILADANDQNSKLGAFLGAADFKGIYWT